jgi:hypothetical protein
MLVDHADDVAVTGVVTARWRPLFPGARCDADILLQATHVSVLKSLAKPHAPPAMDAGFLFRWGGFLQCMPACAAVVGGGGVMRGSGCCVRVGTPARLPLLTRLTHLVRVLSGGWVETG